MLDLVAREVARIRERSGSAVARADTGRTNLPTDRVQNALLIEAKQLRPVSSNPDSQVGRMPPQPPTWRGEMGAVLVRLVRRALFWYSQQVNEVVGKIAEVLFHHAQNIGEAVTMTAKNSAALEQLSVTTAGLSRDQTALRSSVRNLEQLSGTVTGLTRDLDAVRASNRRQDDRLEQISEAVAALQGAVRQQEQLSVAITALQSLAQEQQANHRMTADRIEAVSAVMNGSAAELEPLRAGAERRERLIAELTGRLRAAELYAQAIRAELAVERSRVSLLMQERRQVTNGVTPQTSPATANLGEELGPLYLQFENAFRGSRGEIKERASERLPLFREKGIGSRHMPILDLGCGRGEWLEVLSENGFTASGVESNAAFAEECRTRGFTVHHGDAMRYLQEALPESLGAITGFHIIEHLPFSVLLTLLDEAVRVLKPGGILMLETPNPANLIVGAHTFYLDPTHVRPLPADLVRFLVEARGFCDTEILPLHPFPDCYQLDQRDSRVAEVLNQFLYGPRDYLVTARRP